MSVIKRKSLVHRNVRWPQIFWWWWQFDKILICCKKCQLVIKVQYGGRVNTMDEQSHKDKVNPKEERKLAMILAQLIPDCIGWYWLILADIRWYWLISDGIGWYQMILADIRWFRMISDDIGCSWFRVVSDRAAQRENGQSEILATVATNRELTKFADTEEGGGKRRTIYHKYIKHQMGRGNSCNVDSIYYRESRGAQMARRAPNPENS